MDSQSMDIHSINFQERSKIIGGFMKVLSGNYGRLISHVRAIRESGWATKEQAMNIEILLNQSLPVSQEEQQFAFTMWYLIRHVVSWENELAHIFCRNRCGSLLLLVDADAVTLALNTADFLKIGMDEKGRYSVESLGKQSDIQALSKRHQYISQKNDRSSRSSQRGGHGSKFSKIRNPKSLPSKESVISKNTLGPHSSTETSHSPKIAPIVSSSASQNPMQLYSAIVKKAPPNLPKPQETKSEITITNEKTKEKVPALTVQVEGYNSSRSMPPLDDTFFLEQSSSSWAEEVEDNFIKSKTG